MSKIIKQLGELEKELTKVDLENLAKEHVAAILSNEKYDLLKVYIEFKRYEIYLKTLIQEIKEDTFNQAREVEQDSFEYAKAKVSFSQRRTYDYSTDEGWLAIDEELNQLKKRKKEREELLKKLEGDEVEIVNEETGEVEILYAPIETFQEVLRVKL
jgi:hypothetical protein